MRLGLLALTLGAVLIGCTQHSPLAPQATTTLPEAPLLEVAGDQALVGGYTLQIDPLTLEGAILPPRSLEVAGFQAVTFDLDIDQFLLPDTLTLVGISRETVTNNPVVEFQVTHPYGAPNLALPGSPTNRADLGVTGRLLLLADVKAGTESQNTYFGSVIANTESISVPDGFVDPGNLLAQGSFLATAFPYVLLADEAEDNRVGVSNGADPKGNYDDSPGGWQASNIGGANDGWTGYDYLHPGQRITNTFTLNAATLATGPVELPMALLVKYTRPNGATPRLDRSLHLPQTPVDVLQFAYRMPYSALDVSQVALTDDTLLIQGTNGATVSVAAAIRDWDLAATEASDSDVSDESDITLVQVGGAGAPSVDVSCPALAATPATLTLSTPTATGLPGDEAFFDGLLTNQLTPADGEYGALVRVTDAAAGDPNAAEYRFGLDPATLIPDPARGLAPITYQGLRVTVLTLNPPTISLVSPSGTVGPPGAIVSFSATASDPPITGWSWDFGGGATPNLSTDESPLVTLNAPNTYNGTVTAANAAGTSPSFPFSYTVSAPTPPTWLAHTVDAEDNMGQQNAMTAFGTGFAIAYNDADVGVGAQKMKVAVSNVAEPDDPSDWVLSTVMTINQGTLYNDICVHDNRLAVSGYNGNALNDLVFGISNFQIGGLPTGTGDWDVLTLDGALENTGFDTGIGEVAGKLVICYRNQTGAIRAISANAVDPDTLPDWNAPHDAANITDVASGAGAFFGGQSVADFNGKAAYCFLPPSSALVRGAWVAIATTASPVAHTDWTRHNVDPTTAISGNHSGLTAVGGRLALAYLLTPTNEFRVAVSSGPAPASSADYTVSVIATGNGVGQYPSLIDVGGRLAIAYRDNLGNAMMAARALLLVPTGPADWQFGTVEAGSYGQFSRGIALKDGKLAVAYRDNTLQDLRFARAQAVW